MMMPRSALPSSPSQPIAPAYGPRAVVSTSAMISIVRSFGAPVIEPPGKSACTAAMLLTSGRSRPRIVVTSWCTVG